MYSSTDGFGRQLFPLLFIMLVAVWALAVIQRTMHKGMRRASLLTGVLLAGWLAVRLLKYNTPFGDINRYFWYSFYPFLLALPLALLWLAWIIDHPEHSVKLQKWLAFPAAASGAGVVFVFTNDLHTWVFRVDSGNQYWGKFEYSYGPGYYLVVAVGVATALVALAMLLVKSWRSPHKGRIVFPLAFCALLAQSDEDTLLFAAPITGGRVLWQEDISALNRLQTIYIDELTELAVQADVRIVLTGQLNLGGQHDKAS